MKAVVVVNGLREGVELGTNKSARGDESHRRSLLRFFLVDLGKHFCIA